LPRDLLADDAAGPRDLFAGDDKPAPKPASLADKIIASVHGRFAAGVVDPLVGANALYDKVVGGGLQQITSAGGYLPNAVSDYFGRAKNSGQILANQETDRINAAREAMGAEPGSTDWARLAGNVASPVNAVLGPGSTASLPAKIASGVAIGASQPVYTGGQENPTDGNYTTDVLLNSGLGGITSGILGSLGSKAKTPEDVRRAAQVKLLQNYGVQPSVGQQVGGHAGAVEEHVGAVPYLGSFVKNAQVNRPTLELNKGVYADVLKTLDDKMPAGLAVGRESVDHLNTVVNEGYNTVLPKLSLPVDNAKSAINEVLSEAKTMPVARQDQLRSWTAKILDAENYTRQLEKDGSQTIENIIPGSKLKGIVSDIKKEAFSLSSDPSSEARSLGQSLFDLHDAVLGAAKANSPQAAKELASVDAAYTKLIRLNKAAGMVGAKDGVVSPAQLQSAILSSGGKRAAAKASGRLPMQDLGDAAANILSPKTLNSGTPEKGLLAGLALAAMTHPTETAAMLPTMLPAGALAGLAYTRAGQRILGKAVTGGSLADALRKYSPKAAPLVTNAASQSGPYITRGATALFNQ